jgi:hypothetical protein
MNRITGSTTISLNVDVLASGPWDARSIIPYYTGLTDNVTLPYPYKGMVVTVYNDPDITKNGVYYCTNKGTNIPFANSDATWTKVGSDSQTITGNSWTYSSDTLNLLYSTGGTIPITGFTFVNTTGDTILGQLTISADTNPLILSGLTGSTSSVDTDTKFLTLDEFNNVIYQTGVTSTVITSNTWTYSSDTLNLEMSTGGTIPLTGFTFVNTTGDTILGKLIISADTNPLNLSGLTGSTSAATIDTKFLTLDEFNNVIYQTGLTASLPYTGGTSSAGTEGTTAITATLIVSNESTGTTIDLSGALTFENPLPTKESFGSIGQNTTFFAGGKTFQEIIQAMFYPVIPPTITAISTSFTRNTTGGGFSSLPLQIAGTIGNVTLTATYVSGTSTGGVYVAKTGPVTSFVFSGFTEPTPAVTAYTSLNTTAYTVNSNYLVVSGYNTWNCQINFAPGQQPLDDSGAPYYGSGTSDFIYGGTKTPANIVIEGVFPISATSISNAYYTQQTLVSMKTNTTSTFNTADETTSDRQAFILPIMLHNKLQTMELYDGNSQRYVTVTPSEFYTITDFGPVYINSTYSSVAYKQYKYDIRGQHGAQLIRLTFS